MKPRRPAHRLRWTVRIRMTLLYGALFLAGSVLLLTLTYVLVALQPLDAVLPPVAAPNGLAVTAPSVQVPFQAELSHQRTVELHTLLVVSGLALAIMAIVSIGLGWLMAGRFLWPLQVMTTRVQHISEANLHERLVARGADDELKTLADTFDALLERLDGAFEAQRRFVANASHELRTPLALSRATLEIALRDPAASVSSLRRTCERALAAGEQQERLIGALLILARSQRGLDRTEAVDLASVAEPVVEARVADAGDGIRIQADLRPAPVSGDAHLLERLVANLADNAVRYNRRDGWVRVSTGLEGRDAVLRVTNSGPALAAEEIDALFQPFQSARTAPRGLHSGLGLGLSIVDAIAGAHGARLHSAPGPEGGLDIEVRFSLYPEPVPAL